MSNPSHLRVAIVVMAVAAVLLLVAALVLDLSGRAGDNDDGGDCDWYALAAYTPATSKPRPPSMRKPAVKRPAAPAAPHHKQRPRHHHRQWKHHRGVDIDPCD